MRPSSRSFAFALALGILAAGCSDAAATKPTLVFAAASLTAPFRELAREFSARHPEARIDLHVAGTPRLVLQVTEGAPADVFASADESNMQKLVEAGATATKPVVFAHNRLTIVTQKGNPRGIGGLSDLARPDLEVLLCGAEVPAGRYARQALAKAGVTLRPVSDEPSVKAVVTKVRLGEVDAGIVYVTDAAAAKDDVDAVPIPEDRNVVAAYPIAALRTGGSATTGEAFVAFVTSAEGQAVLRRFGFAGP